MQRWQGPEVSDSSVAVGLTGLPILSLISPCLLSASTAASCYSDKLHRALWRADHEPQGLHSGRSSHLLPATEDLCVQSIHQPNHSGKWRKTTQAPLPVCMCLPGTLCGPDLSPRLEKTLRAGYWSLGLDTVIRGTLSLFFKLRAGGPIVSRLNTDVTSSALGSQLSTRSSTQTPG